MVFKVSKMKSSVVIATFNGSRFILEQLDSIIKQTLLPDEIVVSDDGSTDSTVELVQSFFIQHADLPIKYRLIENEADKRGVLGNFQNAVNHSSGEYVFFCDQDDIWFPNKIERLVGVLDSCDEQVVIHNAQVLKETDGSSFQPIDKHLMGNYPFDSNGLYKINGSAQVWLAFYCCAIQGMCICAKREYLLSISPFSKGSFHDIWILFCAAADDTLLAIKDDLAYYRIHDNNVSGIQELKTKRPLLDRIKTFDRKGKDSLLKQYLWYKDTLTYLGDRDITDDKVKRLVLFFTDKRISLASKGKISAVVELTKAYQAGVYDVDGFIVFLHDVAFVLMHTKKNTKTIHRNVSKTSKIDIDDIIFVELIQDDTFLLL